MSPEPKTGVLCMAYGSPATEADIAAYYTHIRGGKRPSAEALEELTQRYRAINGSPLTEITRLQAHALSQKTGLPVFAGMKHAPPFIDEAANEARRAGVERLVGLPLAPHYARISLGGYQRALQGAWDRELVFVPGFHDHPAFIRAVQGLLREALAEGRSERLFFTALPAVMGAVQLMLPAPPAAVRQQADAFEAEPGPTVRRLPGWAWEEFRRTPPSALFKALSAIGSFSSRDWVGEIDVPTAVVVMMRDRGVPPTRQIKLAQSIPGATIHPVDAGHAACMFGSQRFVPVLLEACASVASRIAHPR